MKRYNFFIFPDILRHPFHMIIHYYFILSMCRGEALVTFVRSTERTAQEAVLLACQKYNSLDIGEGFVMQVSKADYSKSNKSLKVFLARHITFIALFLNFS